MFLLRRVFVSGFPDYTIKWCLILTDPESGHMTYVYIGICWGKMHGIAQHFCRFNPSPWFDSSWPWFENSAWMLTSRQQPNGPNTMFARWTRGTFYDFLNVLCWLLVFQSVGSTSCRSTASRKPQYDVHTLKLRTALEKKLQLVSNAAFGCVPTHHHYHLLLFEYVLWVLPVKFRPFLKEFLQPQAGRCINQCPRYHH